MRQGDDGVFAFLLSIINDRYAVRTFRQFERQIGLLGCGADACRCRTTRYAEKEIDQRRHICNFDGRMKLRKNTVAAGKDYFPTQLRYLMLNLNPGGVDLSAQSGHAWNIASDHQCLNFAADPIPIYTDVDFQVTLFSSASVISL